jgi:hypothetical protein
MPRLKCVIEVFLISFNFLISLGEKRWKLSLSWIDEPRVDSLRVFAGIPAQSRL